MATVLSRALKLPGKEESQPRDHPALAGFGETDRRGCGGERTRPFEPWAQFAGARRRGGCSPRGLGSVRPQGPGGAPALGEPGGLPGKGGRDLAGQVTGGRRALLWRDCQPSWGGLRREASFRGRGTAGTPAAYAQLRTWA